MRHREDPIVAVATSSGRGAVGIVRVSGTSLGDFVQRLCGRALVPRHATRVAIADAAGDAIDHGLALFFPAPHSYTGEDVLELQGHGGAVVLQLVVARVLELAAEPDAASGRPVLANLRLAEPGEFTERAFLNDKLDLAQAEAVADLIDAGSESAARSAVRSLEGALSRETEGLVDETVSLRVLVEATLDFPEEEVEFLERAGARARLAALRARLDAVLATARQGALLRDGIRVVLAGQPNAGKSSLLNVLAGAELAIVTPVPGTTRDRIATTIHLEGVPIRIVDTAGLRDVGDDVVERIGIERSWASIGKADVVVFLHDLTRGGDAGYRDEDARIAGRIAAAGAVARVLDVHSKADAVDSAAAAPPETALAVSATTGAGLDRLRRALLERAGWQPAGDGVFLARARHVDALRRAGRHLDAAAAHAEAGDAALELLAEELRAAHDAIGEIAGRMTADELLGAIFSRFCIGK